MLRKNIIRSILWMTLALVGSGFFTMLSVASAEAQEVGIAAKKPILGAACVNCPWGALADKIKEAMKPAYDVQICYNCSGADSTRIVSERRTPRPLTPDQINREFSEPPKGPVEFGVVLKDFLVDAYNGTGFYKKEAPRKNLRLIARIEDPNYFLVATRTNAFITDLKQIKEKKLPVRIAMDDRDMGQDVLKYYGLNKAELESWGGAIIAGNADVTAADVIIHFGSLNNTPESNVWYQVTQKSDLRFLQLPDDLLASMAKQYDWEIGYTPAQYMRGMTKPQKTLISSGTVVYGRDDLPEQFAYDVAKSLDQHKGLLMWSILAFSYDPDTVWKIKDVPLHPGAARYYRERGYMK